MASSTAINKITKMLSLAFKNSNKEEATSAFRQAYGLMNREGVTYEELFNVEIYEGSANVGEDNSDRESELVQKYNTLLARSKQLKADLDFYKSKQYVNPAVQAEFNKVKGELESLKKEYIDSLTAASLYQKEAVRLKSALDNRSWGSIFGACVCSFLVGMGALAVMQSDDEPTTSNTATYSTSPAPVATTTPAPAPVEEYKAPAPTVVKTYTLAYGAKNAKGDIMPLVISKYSDGTIKDNTGDVYTGNRFYATSDYLISIDGKEFTTDNTPAYFAKNNISYAVKTDLQKAIDKGCNVYFTSYDHKLVTLVSCGNKLFYNDVNNFGDVKQYTYDSINENGEMKYTKNGSNKYIIVKGANMNNYDGSYNNTIYSFRGAPVTEYTN